jgi:hypothetical protein
VHSIVDLSDVTFIDESGENLLEEMRSGGAKFVACGVETKHLLKHLRTGGERSVRRFISPVVRTCQKSKSARKSEADERTEV